MTIEPGDFFTSVPAGADAYILSHIIHDWDEDQCLTILGHVRKAMNPASRLLIVEMVLPPRRYAASRENARHGDACAAWEVRSEPKSNTRHFSAKPDFHLTRVVPD